MVLTRNGFHFVLCWISALQKKGGRFLRRRRATKKSNHEISCARRRRCARTPSQLFVNRAQTLAQAAGIRRTGREAARLRFPTCRHKYNPVSAQCQLKNHQVPRAVTHSFPLSISCLFITCVTKNTHLKWWYCFLKDQSHLFLSFSFLFFSVNV